MVPKMCGSERVGNCFVLFCVMHTHSGQKLMWKEMKDRKISVKKIKNCLKLYLSFKCWVNEPHPRSQVEQSLKALGILINLIKECFPRDEGWGWNLPKKHAFAKMPHNMLKFGSANNFSGNIGEWALNGIVKIMQKKHKGDQINLPNNVLYASMKAMLSNML
jgi:hypothetical protein